MHQTLVINKTESQECRTVGMTIVLSLSCPAENSHRSVPAGAPGNTPSCRGKKMKSVEMTSMAVIPVSSKKSKFIAILPLTMSTHPLFYIPLDFSVNFCGMHIISPARKDQK